MAYRLTNQREGGKGGGDTVDSVLTKSSVDAAIAEKLSSEDFYELEPAEVLEVLQGGIKHSELPDIYKLEGEEGPIEDYSYVGAVKARFIYSQQGKEDSFVYLKPLNPNMYSVPAIGEVVVGVKYLGEFFYTTIINIHGNNNFNQVPNVSLLNTKGTPPTIAPGEKLTRDKTARRVVPQEGDVLIEGRFKNHIKLGSNIINEEESPNIHIVAGHLLNGDSDPSENKWREANENYEKQLEKPFVDDASKKNTREKPVFSDLDKDASSIYLTTKEDLFVTPPFKSQFEDAVPPYADQTILINSDKIILNAQNTGNIVLSSVKNVIVSSKEEVIIETPKLIIGGDGAEENIVLGQKLLEALNDIVTILESGLVCPVGAVVPGPGAALIAKLKAGALSGAGDGPLGILSKEHKIQDNVTAATWVADHPDEP